ncbi:MAG: disulfide bond formation protein DsbA [Halieaceae bacterium]|nr:disulfide bond formation protein DsbA [Halieaceae bacterium]|tara:strand:- start:24 stop:632 length:609 start_codon:yes stop_codon:yes gene_type:complete
MSGKVEFLFDFASPNAYFSYHVLREVAERQRVELVLTPVLLGGLFKLTNNQAPMLAFGEVKGKLEYDMLETQRFIDAHGLNKFVFNPHFPINTITLMRGFIAAQDIGVVDQYVEANLSAMWEQGLNMGDPEVAAGVWQSAGLDAAGLAEAIQTQPVKDALLQNTQQAADRGAFGVPTFFVGDEMFFGKERIIQIEQMLQSNS